MKAGNERGAILVATLLVLVLLSLLGAGALMSVTLQTRAGGNLGKGLAAFYAAESGLEVGAATLTDHFTQNLSPYSPTATAIVPSVPFDGNDFNGYRVEYTISNPFNPSNPATIPDNYPFTTALGGQQLIHWSYQYKIESTATSLLTNDSETTSEIIRVLETPLIQYYIFFNDDLSWHNGPQMNSWGRVHTNGNFYYAAQSDTYFRNYDTLGTMCPNTLTVHGNIYVGTYLAQAAAVAPASGTLARAANPMYVRVRNMSTVPAGAPSPNPPTGDCETLPGAGINTTNKATQENRFKTGNEYLVRTGVDSLPVVSANSLKRDGAGTGTGFYERTALNPLRDGVDGMLINVDAGAVQILLTLHGQPTIDVTTLVHDFQVRNGVNVNLGTWPADARRRSADPVGVTTPADAAATTIGTGNPATDMVEGSIVYSPESPVREAIRMFSDNGAGVITWHNHRFTNAQARKVADYNIAAADNTEFDHNPWYPCVMEIEDGRENRDVDFTVIDMQMLQYWLYDYIDFNDDNTYNNSPDTAERSLLMYVTRSQPGSNAPVNGSGVNALQAIKVVGGQAGRTHGNRNGGAAPFIGGAVGTRQSAGTFRFRTTLVTPEPVYLVGDFNAPGASGGNNGPGIGTSIVSDAAIFISNGWSKERDTWDKTGGNHAGSGTYTATNTTYNTAFFTGRYNFRNGGGGEEGGIHNFTRFNEDWGAATCTITGCLLNLWWSEKATAPHGGAYYNPPTRVYGWDTGFASYTYWPPYVPSSYSIERSVWQEN